MPSITPGQFHPMSQIAVSSRSKFSFNFLWSVLLFRKRLDRETEQATELPVKPRRDVIFNKIALVIGPY